MPKSFIGKINTEIELAIRAMWNGNTEGVNANILNLVGGLLEEQVTNSFGKTFSTIDYTTPDAEMLTRLTRDVWQFSAAKNYQQMRDMTLALKDANGKLRSFSEFKDAATKINDTFNKTWLRTEYDSAVGSATMAARWVDFKKEAENQPYLRYITVGDERVRTDHRLLDGIIRKIQDSFWRKYYPPNGYKCRCDVEQLASSTAVETKDIPNVPVNPMFQTNLAEDGLVFPKGHPYYEGVPQDLLRNALYYLPPDAPFRRIHKASKGNVEMHLMHGIDEMEANVKTAKILADNGHNIQLLPVLGEADDKIREKVYGSKNFIKRKNPDAFLDNDIFDFKQPKSSSKTSIHNAIEHGQKQADNVLIHLPEEIPQNNIERFVKGKMNQARYIDKVYVINKTGEPIKFTRDGFGLPKKAKRPTSKD